MTQILAAYIILTNIVTFWVFGHDKRQARNKGWRVPEKTLFLLAAAGGSIGAIAGMQIFRHKTRHWKFRLGMPLILGAQCVAGWWILGT